MAFPAFEKINLKKLKPRETAALIFAFLVVAGAAYYKFEYQARQKEIKQAETKLKDLNATVSVYRQAILSPDQIKAVEAEADRTGKEISELREKIVKIKSKMQERDVDILQQLKKEAEINGAVLRSFKTSEKQIARGNLSYKQISVSTKIYSEYESLTSFIERLETIPAILSLQSFEVLRNDEILPKVETRLYIQLSVL